MARRDEPRDVSKVSNLFYLLTRDVAWLRRFSMWPDARRFSNTWSNTGTYLLTVLTYLGMPLDVTLNISPQKFANSPQAAVLAPSMSNDPPRYA